MAEPNGTRWSALQFTRVSTLYHFDYSLTGGISEVHRQRPKPLAKCDASGQHAWLHLYHYSLVQTK